MFNNSKKFFAYVRVSTVRQGQSGTSLTEQRSAIERHAAKHELNIVKEYEEQETAAKHSRPVFLEMIDQIKKGRANGLVIHKIDRSARNLRDWAELGALIDKGLEVHFANENLDLESRGGRLSADIQAVVAADFIRNLKEEVKKGLYGRLKQGFYPFPAPVGYRDNGAGKKKSIDPKHGPMIRQAYELYLTGNFGLRTLTEEMELRGLRGKHGNRVSRNGIASILHNPFYKGQILIRKHGKVFEGNHTPLVTKAQFDAVQEIMKGKTVTDGSRLKLAEDFLFRRLLKCGRCGRSLIAENQKTHKYYRCHNRSCEQKSIREDQVMDQFLVVLKRIRFSETETKSFEKWFTDKLRRMETEAENTKEVTVLELNQVENRIARLTDALIDGLIEKEDFVAKKRELIERKAELEQKLERINVTQPESFENLRKNLELVKSAYSCLESGNYRQKRELIRTVASNFSVVGKTVVIKLNMPFKLLEM